MKDYHVLEWNYEYRAGWEQREAFETIEEAQHYIRKQRKNKDDFWIVKHVE